MPRYDSMQSRLFANSIPVHCGHCVNGEPSDCWLWIGNVDHHGYGRLTLRRNGRHLKVRAHRASAEFFLGIELGTDTWDHHCRQTSCIHPNHGEPCTNAENASRMRRFHANKR